MFYQTESYHHTKLNHTNTVDMAMKNEVHPGNRAGIVRNSDSSGIVFFLKKAVTTY
jgi:hypothetical protein